MRRCLIFEIFGAMLAASRAAAWNYRTFCYMAGSRIACALGIHHSLTHGYPSYPAQAFCRSVGTSGTTCHPDRSLNRLHLATRSNLGMKACLYSCFTLLYRACAQCLVQ